MYKYRQEIYKTRRGPHTAPELDDVEEKVLGICSNISGLDARNDSDNIPELLSENINFQCFGGPVIIEVDDTNKLSDHEEFLVPIVIEDNNIQESQVPFVIEDNNTHVDFSEIEKEPMENWESKGIKIKAFKSFEAAQ